MRISILIKGLPLSSWLKGLPSFIRDYCALHKQAGREGSDFPFSKLYPFFEDKYQESGTATGHYFHQDLLVARKIFDQNPIAHVDIGSRFDGFIAHVASFRDIEVLDIREQPSQIPHVQFKRADLMSPEFQLRDYCDSISCLHALEHFGLGRYGDRIDCKGHLVGWRNIYGMLKQGGKLYFSVPIGEQRIEFNAHRVFSISYLLEMMDELYRIDSFNYVDDSGNLIRDPVLNEKNINANFSCHYGCGIFELTKK